VLLCLRFLGKKLEILRPRKTINTESIIRSKTMKTKTQLALAAMAIGMALCVQSASAQAGRQQLGIDIRDNPKITELTYHVSGISDPASTARQVILDTAACKAGTTSAYSDVGVTHPWIHTGALTCMKTLAVTYGYTYRVTEICGGDHSSGSYHYAGTAFDVDLINGVGVSSSNPYWTTFNQRCRNMGSIESLGPGDAGHDTHVHNAWPSGTSASSAGGCIPAATIVVDNNNAGFSVVGAWATGTSAADKHGADYRYKSTAPLSEPATWSTSLPSSGSYTVYVWYPQGANRSTTAPYIISTSAGTHTEYVNQQVTGGQWVIQGAYSMAAGANTIKLSCWTGAGFIVVADAVKWVK
jgi:hypothetical protein